MKYAHLSDLHIGSWRDERMRNVSLAVFARAMEMCVEEKVDFILFAGDLFNTALPAIEALVLVAQKLRELKEMNIPVYIIPGSHDFSMSGKTMLDVLENGGLLINVCKGQVVDKKLQLRFTTDAKTGAHITGMLGKKGMLDRLFYEDLDREHLHQEKGYKIFMFHTALSELKPTHLERMDTQPVSLLPLGFDYYAGGHVHHRMEFSGNGYKLVTQPGALFPNNFAELEKYGHGGFFVIDTSGAVSEGNAGLRWLPVIVRQRIHLTIDCDGQKPEDVYGRAVKETEAHDVNHALVTMRFSGTLAEGRVTDVRMKDISAFVYAAGAHVVLKNAAELRSKELEEVKIGTESIEDIEAAIISEHAGQITVGLERTQEIELTRELIHALSLEKKEGETSKDFEDRVKRVGLSVVRV